MRRSTFKNILNNQGMTLLEVMIALAIFSVFIVSYMVSQGYSIKDSTDLKEDIKLRALCLQVIDETTVTPPIFRESLTLTPETKKFEDDEDYSYTVIWKRLVIPDISKIQGSDPLEQDGKQSREGVIQKKIFAINLTQQIVYLKINMKKLNKKYYPN